MPDSKADLRVRAFAKLSGQGEPAEAVSQSCKALRVLHDLALSPGRADDALALLHELQVHQVELDLQDESLRDSVAELETDLQRQVQLYDSAPAGLLTIDSDAIMCGLNLTAAGLMGAEREALLGRSLDGFLAPRSRDALHAMLARIRDGGHGASETLQLMAPEGMPRAVRASANADPAGGHFQLAFVELGEQAV